MLPHLKDFFSAHPFPASAFPHRLFSPGRINIIGEHTDYTGGWVMPASIDKGIEFYARPIQDDAMRLHAVDLGVHHDLPLPVTGKTGELWVDYLAGVIHEFQLLGHEVPAMEVVFGGNVPRGSGMSSSAALEGGMAFLLNEVTGAGLSRAELAVLSRRSSNNFIGVPTGIMDQFASLNGVAEGPIMLNCDTLEFTPVSANLPGYSWLLVNSMVTHELGSSEYPVRVRECAEALAAVQQRFPEVTDLSAVTPEQLSATTESIAPVVRKRARYVVEENQRVRAMAAALKAGDVARAGALLNATHRGLSKDYDVSCPEVDFLQATATAFAEGRPLGSRIMGGGFGGCTINLVPDEIVEALKTALTDAYEKEWGKTPEFYEVAIGAGTRLL